MRMDGQEIDLPERVLQASGAKGNDETDYGISSQGQPGMLRAICEHDLYLFGAVGALIESSPFHV